MLLQMMCYLMAQRSRPVAGSLIQHMCRVEVCYEELELVADLLWVLDPLLWPEPNEFRSYGCIVIMIIYYMPAIIPWHSVYIWLV